AAERDQRVPVIDRGVEVAGQRACGERELQRCLAPDVIVIDRPALYHGAVGCVARNRDAGGGSWNPIGEYAFFMGAAAARCRAGLPVPPAESRVGVRAVVGSRHLQSYAHWLDRGRAAGSDRAERTYRGLARRPVVAGVRQPSCLEPRETDCVAVGRGVISE